MKKVLLNLPVLMTAVFCLAATAAITAVVFADPGPTKLLSPTPVPDFTVTTHTGETLTRDDLLGEVWVCDFFLTRCTGVCPILGVQVAGLCDQMSEDPAFDGVRIVSFSVDPDYDTIDRLKLYRQKNLGVWDGGSDVLRADLESRWVHTRAEDRDAFWEIVGEGGFGLHVGEADPEETSTPVVHSSKLVLVDKQGNIRGYYEGMSDKELPALLADIRRLRAE